MATYNLAFPDVAIDAILTTAYHLQQAGYIFRGSASDYSGTPTEREWVIAPAGFTGLGLYSAVPQGSIGVCLYNGTAWVGKIINVATIDSTPTQNSGNAVSSGGAYAAINQLSANVTEALGNLTFTDTTPSAFQDEYINMKVSTTEGGVEHILTYLTILAATTSKAGLLTAEDKQKIDSFLTNLRSLTFADTTASADQGTQITETLKATIGGAQEVIDSITLLAATSSKAGLLSASDKAYIDALPAALNSLSNSISAALALMESLVGYYVCDTAAATAAKTVAATGYSLTNGGCIRIKMTNANTAANVTLNINSTGAKALYYDGAQASSTNTWDAGEVLEVYYDGTQYQCASGGGGKFATGEKVKNVSLLDNLDNSGNLPKSSAVKSETDNLYANIGLFECTTAKGTAAKTVSAAGYKLTIGGRILVRMTNENTAASPTLNINSTGVKPLFYYGEIASSTNSWKAGSLLVVYYDGTNYNASLYVDDAKHIEYDGTLSGLPNTVQGAIDNLGNSVGKIYPPEVSAANLTCQSTNTSKLTVTNTSDNNYKVDCITQTSSVYGKIYLPAMKDGYRYRMTFTYTNSNTGSQDWSIRASNNADIIRPQQMEYTLEQKNYSWDFVYTSNMSYLNFFCNNMITGSSIVISNLQFTCIDNYDVLKENVAELDETVNGLLPNEINTNNLSCSSTNTEKFTVECVSDNNYKVTSIEKTSYIYGYIALPVAQLVTGKKYRVSFNVTTDNDLSASVALSNSTGQSSVAYGQIQHQQNGLFTFDFVHAGNNTSYLRFFCNDIQTGKTIHINDLQIYEPFSIPAIYNDINRGYEDAGNMYPAVRKINLSPNNYRYTKTSLEWNGGTGQAMAMYGDYIVRIAKDGKLSIYLLSNNETTQIFESENNLAGHNNSAQFAPYKGSSDEFPLLYVSAFDTTNICKVYRLTTSSVELVQTITFNLPSTIVQGVCNTQIGDDGCLYMYSLETGVVKLITPNTSISSVELGVESVLDFWRFNYQYGSYVWQGGVISNGMLFMPIGGAGNNDIKSFYVFDLVNRCLLTQFAVNGWNGEAEDCDVKDGKIYVVALYGQMSVIEFL